MTRGTVRRVTDVIAHRGASRLAPENMIEAFEVAVGVGADGVELDVRRTSDGVLVVNHDAHVNDGRVIVGTRWRDLPGYVPSLGEALDTCVDVWVNIEIKNHEREPDFDPDDRVAVEVLAMLAEREVGRWLISSFRMRTVDRCRLLDRSVPTAFLTPVLDDEVIEDVSSRGHTAIHPWEPGVTAEKVARCHEVGILLNAWTCNDADRFVALAAAGVDGIVTDVPDVMIAALGARGA